MASDFTLQHAKLGHHKTVDGVDFPFRAEVGLLTRNIKFMGSKDVAWHEDIPACPEGFNTGRLKHYNQNMIHTRIGSERDKDIERRR